MKKNILIGRLATLFIVTAALFIVTACTKSTPLEQHIKAFEADIQPVREALMNVGLSVVYVENNEIVYQQAFGLKNIETNDPLSCDDMFRIASISKSFTTTSLLQLVEAGLVTLDTDVSDLAGFTIRNPRYPETPITLEMLLSHTSSINDSEGYYTIDRINPSLNPDWANCYNNYAPGKGYEYCNLNLNLAGTFLEKLSGERFDQYVVKHVLNPLGLYGGYCVDSLDTQRFAQIYHSVEDPEFEDYGYDAISALPEPWMGHYVNASPDAYAPRSEQIRNYVMGEYTTVFSPTGGMKISAPDLARYMIMHMNDGLGFVRNSENGEEKIDTVRIIRDDLAREMKRPRSTDENYGLTLWQTDTYSPGTTLTGHTGSAYGMRSAMFFNPEKKYGFVVISNGAMEGKPESVNASDPSGSCAGADNILTATLRLMHHHFVGK